MTTETQPSSDMYLKWQMLEHLYQPPVEHQKIEQDNTIESQHRILIQDIVVCYVENIRNINMTIEGNLSPDTVNILVNDLLDKLQVLENKPWQVILLKE